MNSAGSSSSSLKKKQNLKDEFAVVLKLRRKDGSYVDLLIHDNDDPAELARQYAQSVGNMPPRAVAKLAQLIGSKRGEALKDYDLEISHGEYSSTASSPNSLSAATTPLVAPHNRISSPPTFGAAGSSPTMLVDSLGNLVIGSHVEGSTEKRRLFERRVASPSVAVSPVTVVTSSSLSPGSGRSSPGDRSVSFGTSTSSPDFGKAANFGVSHNHSPDAGSQLGHMLYDEAAKQKERQRQLSLSLNAERDASLDASSFVKSLCPGSAYSLSGSTTPRSGDSQKEHEAASAVIYYRQVQNRSAREAAEDKARLERAIAKQAVEDEELTFKPKLATSPRAQGMAKRRSSFVMSPKSSMSSAQASPNISVFVSNHAANPTSSFPDTSARASPVWPDVGFTPLAEGTTIMQESQCSSSSAGTLEAHRQTPAGTASGSTVPSPHDVHTSRTSDDLLQLYVQRSRAASAERATPSPDVPANGTWRSLSPPWHRLDESGQSSIAARRGNGSTLGKKQDGIVDWLYYQSRKDHDSYRRELEAKVQKEREHSMPFRPVIDERSKRLAEKKREEKILRYAMLETKNGTPVSDGNNHSRGSSADSKRSRSRPKSPMQDVYICAEEERSPKTLLELALPALDGNESDAGSVSTLNPFDVHAHELEYSAHTPVGGGLLSYSPNAYFRAARNAANASSTVAAMSPKSRTDALFLSLYNGRLDAEVAHKLAADKHMPNYTFSPKLSSGAASIQIEATQELFCARLHNTPKRIDSTPPDKHTPSPKRVVIDPHTEEQMVKRMSKLWPRRDLQAREGQQRELESALRSRTSLCHDNKPCFTNDFSRLAREKSLSEIFDVLLLSAAFSREMQAHEQEQQENLDNVVSPETRRRRRVSVHKLHTAVEAHLQEEVIKNAFTIDALTAAAKHDHLEATSGEVLLDTMHAQTRFLEPKNLRDALEIMIVDARPAVLPRAEFINRCEVLIKSGVAPPINAILIAPQRPTRFKHTDEMIADQHVRPPLLEAKQVNNRMNNGRKGRYRQGYDPMKYAREKAMKAELMAKHAASEEVKECTFAPEIHTAYTWKRNRNDCRGYKDVVIARQSKRLLSKPFTRPTVESPTAASILSRSSSFHNIAEQLEQNRPPSPRIRALASAKGIPILPPQGSKSSSPHMDKLSTSPIFEFDRLREATQYQHGEDMRHTHAAHGEALGMSHTIMQKSVVGEEAQRTRRASLSSTIQPEATDWDRAMTHVHELRVQAEHGGTKTEWELAYEHGQELRREFSPTTSDGAATPISTPKTVIAAHTTDRTLVNPLHSPFHEKRQGSAAKLDDAARAMLSAESHTRATYEEQRVLSDDSGINNIGDGRRTDEQLYHMHKSTDQLLHFHESNLEQQSASIASVLGHGAHSPVSSSNVTRSPVSSHQLEQVITRIIAESPEKRSPVPVTKHVSETTAVLPEAQQLEPEPTLVIPAIRILESRENEKEAEADSAEEESVVETSEQELVSEQSNEHQSSQVAQSPTFEHMLPVHETCDELSESGLNLEDTADDEEQNVNVKEPEPKPEPEPTKSAVEKEHVHALLERLSEQVNLESVDGHYFIDSDAEGSEDSHSSPDSSPQSSARKVASVSAGGGHFEPILAGSANPFDSAVIELDANRLESAVVETEMLVEEQVTVHTAPAIQTETSSSPVVAAVVAEIPHESPSKEKAVRGNGGRTKYLEARARRSRK